MKFSAFEKLISYSRESGSESPGVTKGVTCFHHGVITEISGFILLIFYREFGDGDSNFAYFTKSHGHKKFEKSSRSLRSLEVANVKRCVLALCHNWTRLVSHSNNKFWDIALTGTSSDETKLLVIQF